MYIHSPTREIVLLTTLLQKPMCPTTVQWYSISLMTSHHSFTGTLVLQEDFTVFTTVVWYTTIILWYLTTGHQFFTTIILHTTTILWYSKYCLPMLCYSTKFYCTLSVLQFPISSNSTPSVLHSSNTSLQYSLMVLRYLITVLRYFTSTTEVVV